MIATKVVHYDRTDGLDAFAEHLKSLYTRSRGVPMLQKADVSALNTTADADWAVAPGGQGLRAFLGERLLPARLPDAYTVPFRVRLPVFGASGVAAAEIDESLPKVPSRPATDSTSLAPRTFAGIVPITDELLGANGVSSRVIARLTTNAVVQAVNGAFVVDAVAAATAATGDLEDLLAASLFYCCDELSSLN